MDGSGLESFAAVSLHLSRETKKYHEKPQYRPSPHWNLNLEPSEYGAGTSTSNVMQSQKIYIANRSPRRRRNRSQCITPCCIYLDTKWDLVNASAVWSLCAGVRALTGLTEPTRHFWCGVEENDLPITPNLTLAIPFACHHYTGRTVM